MSDAMIKVSQSLQGIASGLSDVLNEVAGKKVGFTLLVYTEGRASYISNCDRSQVIEEMKSLIEKWESGMPDIPAHKVN